MRSRRPRPGIVVVAVLVATGMVAAFTSCDDHAEHRTAAGDGPSPGDVTESPAETPTRKPKGGDKPDKPKDDEPSPPHVDAPRGFEVVSAKAWTRCNAGSPLKGACPTIVPKTKRNYLVESFGKPGGRFGVLEMSSGAARDAPEANAPPGFAHVVLEAGAPRFLIDFGGVVAEASLSDDLLHQPRSGAVLLGKRRWGGTAGRLLLAEAFPGGGAHGDHLVFQWKRGGVIHRVSLHAWVPSQKAEAALKEMVVSMR
jgi:hypothetical protein